MPVNYGSVSFQEAIRYFRGKLSLPTRAWTDLWQGMHARSFVVAGAMRDDLLVDLRRAVERGIVDGTTLAQFRQDFDALVTRRGWAYNGGRNWRTRVIYDTNLRTAYAAGRYQQLQAVRETRPYWMYEHSDFVTHPRPEHQAWDGLVLRHDDPWWDTHYPPNGWGCQCRVRALSERDLRQLGKAGPDTAPDIEYDEVTVGTRGPSPRTVRVPRGIDPGWAYNVGQAAWGKPLANTAMSAWRAAGADAWQPLVLDNWQTKGRPDVIPSDRPVARRGKPLVSQEQVANVLRALLGGEQKVFDLRGLPVLVHADVLARHIDPARAEWLPFLLELIDDPFEIWLNFERHRGTGKVELRTRAIKIVQLDKQRGLLLVLQVNGGVLEAWTFTPVRGLSYLQNQRRGVLWYGRD